MIFAQMDYPQPYSDFHPELREFLAMRFSKVQAGLEGDSWFWIFDGGERVEIDTFSAMTHQIKSKRPGPHVQSVIDALSLKYKLKLYATPELEPHEQGA